MPLREIEMGLKYTKSYECQACGHWVTNDWDANDHRQMCDLWETIYSCEVCGKAARTSKTVKKCCVGKSSAKDVAIALGKHFQDTGQYES